MAAELETIPVDRSGWELDACCSAMAHLSPCPADQLRLASLYLAAGHPADHADQWARTRANLRRADGYSGVGQLPLAEQPRAQAVPA